MPHTRTAEGKSPLFFNSSGNPTEKEEKRVKEAQLQERLNEIIKESQRLQTKLREIQQEKNSMSRKKESLKRATRKKKENSIKRHKQKVEEKQKMEAMFLGGRTQKRSTQKRSTRKRSTR